MQLDDEKQRPVLLQIIRATPLQGTLADLRLTVQVLVDLERAVIDATLPLGNGA